MLLIVALHSHFPAPRFFFTTLPMNKIFGGREAIHFCDNNQYQSSNSDQNVKH